VVWTNVGHGRKRQEIVIADITCVRHHARHMSPPLVLLLAFDDVQLLDVTGPLEVFAQAATLGDPPAPRYRVEVAAPGGGRFSSESGLAMEAHRGLGPVREPIDTLLVAGGRGTRAAVGDADVIGWVRRAAGRSRRIGSVCTGAFVLARAGLLDGRRATTHWNWCDLLAESHPDVAVERDPIFVRDGDVWTSAGVTAGMDLALGLVAEDHGPAVALDVARNLVLFMQRPGGQSQFSAVLAAQSAAREPLRDLQGWIADNLVGDLTVPALADRAGMSTRHFARAFRAEVGMTPAAYVERVRVEAARRSLESGGRPVELIARDCGFNTPETLHRAFRRRLGTSPGQYRRHFRAA
jgi:transcriptional regulator GlxA family with amidase domain